MAIRQVVFDIGNVLVHWDPRRLYRQLLPNESAVEKFLAQICTQAWNEQQDAGRPFAVAVAELAARFPDYEHLIAAWPLRFNEMLAPMPDSVAIANSLAARGIPLYALSNWSAETFATAHPAHLKVLERFQGRVISGEVGFIKPDPRIYRHLLSTYGLVAQECLFIDDNAANVAAAQQLGMSAHRFINADVLERHLQDEKLLP